MCCGCFCWCKEVKALFKFVFGISLNCYIFKENTVSQIKWSYYAHWKSSLLIHTYFTVGSLRMKPWKVLVSWLTLKGEKQKLTKTDQQHKDVIKVPLCFLTQSVGQEVWNFPEPTGQTRTSVRGTSRQPTRVKQQLCCYKPTLIS